MRIRFWQRLRLTFHKFEYVLSVYKKQQKKKCQGPFFGCTVSFKSSFTRGRTGVVSVVAEVETLRRRRTVHDNRKVSSAQGPIEKNRPTDQIYPPTTPSELVSVRKFEINCAGIPPKPWSRLVTKELRKKKYKSLLPR